MFVSEPIITSLGKIEGRDGIYLDEVQQTFSPNRMIFRGDINGKLCTNNHMGYRWYSYELYFNLVQVCDCKELELCKWKTESKFDEISDSPLIQELGINNNFHHYILSTYDYVYSIIAKNFELKIIDQR